MRNFIPLLFLMYSCYAQTSSVNPVTVSWDANSEPDLAGYNIYIGELPGVYSGSVTGLQQTSFKWLHLQEGKEYFFAVTAYDTANNESDFSQEISAIIRANLTFSLDVSVMGNGSFVRMPAASQYEDGERVEIIPVADRDWRFDKWVGADVVRGDTAVVFMNGDRNVTAWFAPISPGLPAPTDFTSNSFSFSEGDTLALGWNQSNRRTDGTLLNHDDISFALARFDGLQWVDLTVIDGPGVFALDLPAGINNLAIYNFYESGGAAVRSAMSESVSIDLHALMNEEIRRYGVRIYLRIE